MYTSYMLYILGYLILKNTILISTYLFVRIVKAMRRIHIYKVVSTVLRNATL